VMLCVGNDDDVREVVIGEHGAISSIREGALLVDHTITSEALARSMATSANQSGVAFLDAPVSGGQIGAENGALTVIVGAQEQAFIEAVPLIKCYAKSVRRMGPIGAGLDVSAAIQVIAQGAA